MSGTTDELSKMPAASNEEELISEMLSQQQIDDLSNNENDAMCATSGKECINLNICNKYKCKDVKYCNAAMQKETSIKTQETM